ncbi:hypothetical protein PCI56_12265 [Plesiomonas shigelloides subsp. oncorhynchi]|nr:hypothetical protein [Plesiomonas shigelloides]
MYQHAVRALMHGLRFGEHGLPLMGSGDWNDGMDQVGIHGRGESVWLGFFLYDVLQRFAELAERCGDTVIAEMCHQYAEPLQQNLEQHGWDGQWYRRAYFDNGSMLGRRLTVSAGLMPSRKVGRFYRGGSFGAQPLGHACVKSSFGKTAGKHYSAARSAL